MLVRGGSQFRAAVPVGNAYVRALERAARMKVELVVASRRVPTREPDVQLASLDSGGLGGAACGG